MNDKQTWHKGAPPSIGWWPASVLHDKNVIRWWNGKYWSISCYPKYSAGLAANLATVKSIDSVRVEWTERWWL